MICMATAFELLNLAQALLLIRIACCSLRWLLCGARYLHLAFVYQR